MEEKSNLAMLIGYYLSKFDEQGYENLGYSNWQEAYDDVGARLDVKPSRIKNNRDIFDPIHANPRAGWHQRDFRPGAARIIEGFSHLSEPSLRSLVHSILNKAVLKDTREVRELTEFLDRKEEKEEGSIRDFIPRGPTGKKAEEFFIQYHAANSQPLSGELMDMREYGCGYDFEIRNSEATCYVEVKGLDSERGGITFTEKEWDVAASKRESYYVVLVAGLNSKLSTRIKIYNDPCRSLEPRRRIYTTIQISYTIPPNQL